MRRQETDTAPTKDSATSKSKPGAKRQKKSATDVEAEIATLRGEFLFTFIEEQFDKSIQLQRSLQKLSSHRRRPKRRQWQPTKQRMKPKQRG